MASPSEPSHGGTPPEDSFLELLAETLENLDRVPRGQFLQRFFKTIAQLDLSESVSSDYWDQILERRRQLADTLGRPISLKAAMVEMTGQRKGRDEEGRKLSKTGENND